MQSRDKNILIVHPVRGILDSYGEVAEHAQFLNSMKSYQIASFTGKIYIEKLEAPLIVYRAGDIGKYWTTSLPLSPIQQSIDLAIHPKLYESGMIREAYTLPVNKGVLEYTIPEGTIIARGKTAPQYGFPGGKEQIFIQRVNESSVYKNSWAQWKLNNAFYDSSRLSFYRRINYGYLTKFGMPAVLSCLDVYNRSQEELHLHPNHSAFANARAIATNFFIDIAPLLYLAPKIGGGFASLAVMSVDVMAHAANQVRDIPAHSMADNREFFMTIISSWDLSPNIEYRYLEDFDNGEPWTRDINISHAKNIKSIFKPFECIHDAKKWIGDQVRGEANESILTIEKRVEEITEIDLGLSEILLSVDPLPSTLLPSPQMKYNLSEIEFLGNQNGNMMFHVPMGSSGSPSGLEVELHSFLSDSALALPAKNEIEKQVADRVLRIGLVNDSPANQPPRPNQQQTFITNISIAPVGERIGVVATLGDRGSVGVTVGAGGFLVVFRAEFGPQFWGVVGTAAIVAGVLAAAQFFYNRHVKHIEHKIKKAIKRTNEEGQSISEGLKQFWQKHEKETKINYSGMISEINTHIKQILDKINNEKHRAKYANKRKRFKARNAHHGQMRAYNEKNIHLSNLVTSLTYNQINDEFIHNNRDKSSDEIIEIAKEMTSKKISTDADVSAINGLRRLIITKAVNLSTNGNMDEAIAFLGEALNLQYHLPGDISQLVFGDGWGKFEKWTSDQVSSINKKISEINQLIASGENPIPALQKLITLTQQKAKEWDKMESYRREISRSSSYYVTKEQWKKRIEALNTLTETLKSKIKLYENGNHPDNLQLSEVSGLLQQLSSCKNNPASYWIAELQSIKNDKNKLTEELSLIFTEIASHQLMSMVMNHIAQDSIDDAIHILDNLKTLVPQYETISPQYIEKLNEIKVFLKEKSVFWVQRIGEISKIPAENRKEGDEFELVIAEQFITNDLFTLALSGEFENANKILDEYKNIVLESEQSDKMIAYSEGIHELETLHKNDNEKLLGRYSELINSTNKESNLKNTIVISGLKSWILQNIFELASTGKSKEAKADLEELQKLDNQNNDLYMRLTDVINHGELNSDKDVNFWIDAYKNAQDPTNADTHEKSVNSMMKIIATNAVLNLAVKRSQLGFNREAAAIIRELIIVDPELSLNDLKEDFELSHQGQVINIFTKPLQSMLTRYVSDCKPSYARSITLGGLDLLNTIQIVVPNFLTLIAQKAHAHCITHDICGINRNIGFVKSQLSKEINPFDKDFKLFNPDSYYNGALIYGQLILKLVQHAPLKAVISEKYLYKAENIRMNVLHYGHLTSRAAFTSIAMFQLKSTMSLPGGILSAAYSPLTLVTLSSTAVDLIYYGYNQYKTSHGKAIEDYQHYLTHDKVNNTLDTLGTVAFASMITGGFGVIPLTAAIVTGSGALYNVYSESAKKEATGKALIAAIQNINYFRNKNDNDTSDAIINSRNNINNLLLNFGGLAYDKDQPEAANIARIVHLYEALMEYQNNKDYDNILYWTEKYEHNGKSVISKEYQLPPHLAWQIIIGVRLAAYAESVELLPKFREQFQEYSKYVSDCANESKPWYDANWEKVQKLMKEILRYAFQQFIVAANTANTNEEKLSHLSFITQHYSYCEDWFEVLNDDELKFWAACIYHNLGKTEECKLFLGHIKDLKELIISKKQAEFTEQALIILENIDPALHINILHGSKTGDIIINDETLYNSVIMLIQEKNILSAQQLLQELGEFKGKSTLLAFCTYELSKKAGILQSLKLLIQEDTQSRTLLFWNLLHNILRSCITDTVDYNDSYLKLFGLLKLCADKIQTFEAPYELRLEANETLQLANSYITDYFLQSDKFKFHSQENITSEINRLIEWGHKCLRGENNTDLLLQIENILQFISKEYQDGEAKSNFLSVMITPEETRLVQLPTRVEEIIETPETKECDIKTETKREEIKLHSSRNAMFNRNANNTNTHVNTTTPSSTNSYQTSFRYSS